MAQHVHIHWLFLCDTHGGHWVQQVDKAWKLVGRCVAALFSLLQPYRSPVGRFEDMGTIESKAARIWAVLLCHRGMSFDLVKYRGHPSVVKERSLFILSVRVDPSEVEPCSERAKKAEGHIVSSSSYLARGII
jgi:hypothetical protein